MPELINCVIAFFAGIGIVCAAWALAGAILRPRGAGCVTALIRVKTADELERSVRRYEWLMQYGLLDIELLIITDDLDVEGRLYAVMYAGDRQGARVCSMEEALGLAGRR